MRPIPPKLKEELNADPFMKLCCLCGVIKVQFHHAIEYKGSQLNERWAIVPACKECHDNRLEELQLKALNRATKEELARISKAESFEQRRLYLTGKYK